MNFIIGLCHSYSGKVVTFQESFLLVNASFRRRHVSFVWLLLATAPKGNNFSTKNKWFLRQFFLVI